jgi:tetratricopeptide (TPR) repeat protein
MYNVLLAIAAALLLFGVSLVWLKPIAAGIPAILLFGVVLFVLTRRISKILETEMEQIVPLLQARRVDEARAHLDAVRARYGRWQFLLDGQVAAQVGMIDYLQMKWDDALPRLEQGRWRNWTAILCIGLIHHRRGDKDKAYEEFANAASTASSEPMVYAVWVTLLSREGKRKEALEALARAKTDLPDNALIKQLHKTVANKKKINTKIFPQTWYQFFPEDMLKQHMLKGRQQQMAQMQQPRFGGRSAPRR